MNKLLSNNRKSKKQKGPTWEQPVVSIDFNSDNYQVMPTNGSIITEWFYENVENIIAMEIDEHKVTGLGFNMDLYTYIHILTHTHISNSWFFSLFSSINSLLGTEILLAITVSKEQKNYTAWATEEHRCICELLLVFWKVALLVGRDRNSALHTKSHREPEGRPRVQKVQAILTTGVLRTILRILCSQLKYFLPRTTKVRVRIQMSIIYESDHFLKAAICWGKGSDTMLGVHRS